MARSAKVFCVLVMLPSVALGGSFESGRDLIERMSVAMQDLSYSGTFIYAHDGDVETMRIDHSKADGIERERLLSLNGEAREIIRNAESVVCVWPGTKTISVSDVTARTPFPEFDSEQLERLAKLYSFKRRGMDRVAGRVTEVVDIKPLDDYRYGYRLWIDAETFLMLRSVMSDMNNRIIEQVMFTGIEYVDAIPIQQFQTSLQGERLEWVLGQDKPATDTKPSADIPEIDKADIPDGFKLKSDKIIMLPEKAWVRRVMYTDGLASLSMYVARHNSENVLHGVSGMGAVHAFGTVKGNWHVTVVGEVPRATVEMSGHSVVLAAGE